ncbi:hypothetical protein VUR80DRAFT_8398 [Thermomyces stellatus]
MLGRYEGEPGCWRACRVSIGKIGWYCYIPKKLGKEGASGPDCGGPLRNPGRSCSRTGSKDVMISDVASVSGRQTVKVWRLGEAALARSLVVRLQPRHAGSYSVEAHAKRDGRVPRPHKTEATETVRGRNAKCEADPKKQVASAKRPRRPQTVPRVGWRGLFNAEPQGEKK